MNTLHATLTFKEVEIAESMDYKEQLENEVMSLQDKSSVMSRELAVLQAQLNEQKEKAHWLASQTSFAESAVAKMRADMLDEAQRTQQLLLKAENILLSMMSSSPEMDGKILHLNLMKSFAV